MNLSIFHTNSDEFKQYESLYNKFLEVISAGVVEGGALQNMDNSSPSGFLHLVKHKKRWTKDKGQITFLYDKDIESIVGVSAVEDCPLHDQLGSGGNRCWVLHEYRSDNSISKYLLSSNLEWCKSRGKLGMLLTFNEYNRPIYEAISKFSNGKGSALGSIWSDWWLNCILLKSPIRLHDTMQLAVIKPLSEHHKLKPIIDDIINRFGGPARRLPGADPERRRQKEPTTI